MNLELTGEQLALRAAVRRFLAEKAPVTDHVRAMLDSPTGTTDPVWRGLAELGATGMLVPPEHGGAGLTMVDAGIVLEELGAALHPGPWLSTAVAATRALTRLDTAGDEAAKLLAGIAAGATVATVGPLDARSPWPAAGPDRDSPLVHGRLTALPDVAAADVLLVLATTPDGPALFAVDTWHPGLTARPQPTIDGTRKQFLVTLRDTPARRLAAASPEYVEALVDDVLIASAADALGAARAVFGLAVEHAKVRHQFGRPIGAFQAVQHLCADMYETLELARGGVLHGLWAADAAPAPERHLAAVRAKAFAARLASVGDTAIQVLGGLGYTWEHDAHLYLKRLLSWSAFLGGPDRYLQEVGAALAHSLTLPRRTP